MRAILLEHDGTCISIQEDTSEYHNFELISTGAITPGTTILLSSRDLRSIVENETLMDIAELSSDTFEDTMREILERERIDDTHIIRIKKVKETIISEKRRSGIPQKDIMIDKLDHFKENIQKSYWYRNIREYISKMLYEKRRTFMV